MNWSLLVYFLVGMLAGCAVGCLAGLRTIRQLQLDIDFLLADKVETDDLLITVQEALTRLCEELQADGDSE